MCVCVSVFVCVLWLCSICNSVSFGVNMAFTNPTVRTIAVMTQGGIDCVAMDKANNIHLYRELNSEILVDFIA